MASSNNAFTLSGSTTGTSASTPSTLSGNSDFLSLLAPKPATPTAAAAPMSTTTPTGAPAASSTLSGLINPPTASTPTTKSAPTMALQPGSTDTTSVKQLQDYLVSQGLMTQDQVNTGYGTYGPQTTAAVAALQKKLGVDNSSGVGYFGPLTMAALNTGSSTPSTTWSGLVSGATPLSSLYGGSSSQPAQQNITPPSASIPAYKPPVQTAQFQPQTTSAPVQTQTPPQQTNVVPPQAQGTPQPADLSRSGVMGGLIDATKDTSRIDAVNKQIADLRASLADQTANINNEGIPLEFKQGRGQVLQTQEAQKESALTGLLNAEVTSRGQNISGLTSAAGFSQPIQVPYSNQLYQPDAKGNFAPAGGGSLDASVGAIAQKVKNGTMTYDQGVSALSGYGQGGVNALQQALGSGFNVNQSNATGAVTESQTQQVAQYKSALQQGQNLQNQLKDLITTFGINPNDINAMNSGLQLIARNTSNPHYQQFVNYINDIANTYSQVLTPPGGSATDTTRGIASSMINATASGASIIDTMKALDNAAQAKIAGVSTTGSAGGTPNPWH